MRAIPLASPGLALLLAAAVLGAVQFFRLQRLLRLMEDLPTARIRSAAQGYVELKGTVLAPEAPLQAPFTGVNCAWWRIKIERCKSEGQNAGWEITQTRTSDTQFWLDDGSGRCIVDPEGATVRATHRRTWVGATPKLVPEALGSVIWSGDRDHRYTEEIIVAGEPLYAIGEFTSLEPLQGNVSDDVRETVIAWKADPSRRTAFDANRDGQLDTDEFEALRRAAIAHVAKNRTEQAISPQTHLLRKPRGGRPFLLSTIPDDKLQTKLRWQSWAWLGLSLLASGFAGSTILG